MSLSEAVRLFTSSASSVDECAGLVMAAQQSVRDAASHLARASEALGEGSETLAEGIQEALGDGVTVDAFEASNMISSAAVELIAIDGTVRELLSETEGILNPIANYADEVGRIIGRIYG